MFAAAVVGFKKSGKTTLCESLGRIFQESGLKVAAVKCSHHDQLDAPGTDTQRLAEVYTSVGAVLPQQAAVFWNRMRYVRDLLPLLDGEGLIVEGGKQLGWLPRVLVLRSPEEAAELRPELALCTFGPVHAQGLPAVEDVSQLAGLIRSKGFVLPGLDCGDCGREDCAGLAADILAGKATAGSCQALKPSCSVTVNGATLGMNHFVRDLISGSILGMLSQLKGFAPGTIEISIEHNK